MTRHIIIGEKGRNSALATPPTLFAILTVTGQEI